MIGLLMTTVVLFMRSALLYLVAAFAPIVWSSSVSPVMRGSGRRLVHVTVALVLAKPAITVTLVVGAKLLANAGAPGADGQAPDGAAALGTLVTGFACFAIAGLVAVGGLPAAAVGRAGGGRRRGSSAAGDARAMTAVQAGLMVKSLGAIARGVGGDPCAVPSTSQATGRPAGLGRRRQRLRPAASDVAASGSAATRRPADRRRRPPPPTGRPDARPTRQSRTAIGRRRRCR